MDKLWNSGLEGDRYQNPILYADYSDPDVIRVDDTYYMTASSFNYVPGLPILVSKDLINWELKNYAVKTIEYPDYVIPQHAKGIWAPAIRYRNGRFYIYYGMPDEGIFMVSTENPLGEWDAPVLVLEGKGLIDPCPFWDDDGKAYIVHAYAKSRIGFKSFLGIFQMSEDGKEAISEDHFIYDGTSFNITIEGPKVYKRDGKYYILAPAGGVKQGWQTALRADNIYGPYEDMVVMAQGDSTINGPHQGGLVDTPYGDEWFIHFQYKDVYGRVALLQPVTWKDGWPVIGRMPEEEGSYTGTPYEEYDRPKCRHEYENISLQASDDFSTGKISNIWQWLGNYNKTFYDFPKEGNGLRLHCINPSGDEKITLWRSSNVLTQKIVCPYFRAKIKIHTKGLKGHLPETQDRAGIAIIGGDYAYLALKDTSEGFRLSYGVAVPGKNHSISPTASPVSSVGDMEEIELTCHDIGKDIDELELSVTYEILGGRPMFYMGYSLPSGESATILESYTFLPTGHQWVGAKLAIFALGTNDGAYADFEYINVTKINQ